LRLRGSAFSLFIRGHWHIFAVKILESLSRLREFVVAARAVVVFRFPAVRDRRDPASEPRQALIGATVVCPDLPRFPGGTFFVFKERNRDFEIAITPATYR